MFLCPITSDKLRAAYVRGFKIWYSPACKGRLITRIVAKRILGEHIGQELWVRSNLDENLVSWKKCPSCSKQMKLVKAPSWAGGYTIDVCRRCHVLWLDKDEFPEIPMPKDMISKEGDATRVVDIANAEAEILIQNEEMKDDSLVGKGPSDFWAKIPAFFLLPVEMKDHGSPKGSWMTWSLAIFLFLIHLIFTSKNAYIAQEWGFKPADPFRYYGITLISWGFIHGSWLHLLSNLYFFGVFADDVEACIGKFRFFVLIIFTLVISALCSSIFAFNKFVPHIGFSSVIMGIMVCYGLIFRKSRIAFLVPYTHLLSLSKESFTFIRAMSWIRISAIWVIILFLIKDFIFYLLLEVTQLTRISYSGHLVGALCGFAFWYFIGAPNWYLDSDEEKHTLKEKLSRYE